MGYKQMPDGTWSAFHSERHPITKQSVNLRRIKIPTKAEAKRVEIEIRCAIKEKIKGKIQPKWGKLVDDFLIYFRDKGVSEKSIESYGLCLKAHTLPDWNDRFADQITSNEIRTLIKVKVGSRSESHQKNLLKFIRAVFNYAIEMGYISKNPAPIIKFRIGEKLKTVLTEEQARRLLYQAKLMRNEWYFVWSAALYTGMRNGELFALTWDNVILEERQIHVKCGWDTKDGFKDYTKSGDDRIVEIAPPLLLMLKELKLENFDSAFVLPRIGKWEKGEQARELRMFLEGLGIPRIRFHDLRATWATLMLSKGIEPIKVMLMGGWKDLKTMQRYIRKAGVDIRGMTDRFVLHNPSLEPASVLDFEASK